MGKGAVRWVRGDTLPSSQSRSHVCLVSPYKYDEPGSRGSLISFAAAGPGILQRSVKCGPELRLRAHVRRFAEVSRRQACMEVAAQLAIRVIV
jgi:hypothetical protein